MLFATTLIALVASSGALSDDPSLYVPFSLHDAAYMTVTEELSPIVLDYSGVEILWDDQTEEFSATVGGNDVNDLVTGTTAEGFPSFEGKFTTGGEPTVHGYVVAGGSSGSYTVYLTVPNSSPLSLDISNPTGVNPLVNVARSCDCSDSANLDCSLGDCNNGASCDDETETCEWSTISA